MDKTWILVAHRGGARLFENLGPDTGLTLVEAIPHPEGRLQNQEINADRPGRSFDSMGHGRHSMGKEVEPTEQLAQRFAKKLSEKLDLARAEHRFSKLMLVAEPRFLGQLRDALPPHTAALVSATLDKDLIGIEDRDLPGYLGKATHMQL